MKNPNLYFTYETDEFTFNGTRAIQLMKLGMVPKVEIDKCLKKNVHDSSRKPEVLDTKSPEEKDKPQDVDTKPKE